MKKYTHLQTEILDKLNDGKCHSGNKLGSCLSVSRTTIWKQIKKLNELGAAIQQIPKQGYQLNFPFIALQEEKIRHHLGDHYLPLDFHLFSEVDSTNRYLKDLTDNSLISICCAEKQTKGRGRFGRNWDSPFGENIYLSCRWKLNCCLSTLSGLSLVVSLAILDSLQQQNLAENILLKWPNDLLWQDRKLCGVLIEVVAESNGWTQIIIGIGMNVNSRPDSAQASWCSLAEIHNVFLDRNRLIAALIKALDYWINDFLAHDFARFIPRWQQADYLKNKYITAAHHNNIIQGVARGVNEQGQLCIEDDKGAFHYLSAGDTTLKRN